jgi:hypothetical protein
MGERYGGNAILGPDIHAHHTDNDLPDLHGLPPNHDWRSSDG